MRLRATAAAAAVAITGWTLPAASLERVVIAEIPPGVERVVADYGTAFLTGDAGLLEGLLSEELRDGELQALANAAEVPFSSYEVRATTHLSGDLASQRVQGLYPDRRVATYHVIESTRIGGEPVAYQEHGAFTFVREAGRAAGGLYDGWRLLSKSDLDVLGFFSPYHLWDEGPVSVLESTRFVLLTRPEVADEMRGIVDISEEAMDTVQEFWPREVQERFVIVAPSTTEELGRILRTTLDLTSFVAFVAGGADRFRGWEPTGPRLFVHLQNMRRYGRTSRLQILAHELVHAVTRPLSGPHIPLWVEEGLAELGAGTTRGTDLRAQPPPDDFPSRERFGTGPVAQIQAVYAQSQLAFEVLEAELGREAVAGFYEALGLARVVAGTEVYHVRRAVEAAGWTYEDWLAAWQAELG